MDCGHGDCAKTLTIMTFNAVINERLKQTDEARQGDLWVSDIICPICSQPHKRGAATIDPQHHTLEDVAARVAALPSNHAVQQLAAGIDSCCVP